MRKREVLGLPRNQVDRLRKVIELDPEDPDIWLDLSVVYADRKEFEKALETLEEGLKWHDEHADTGEGAVVGRPRDHRRVQTHVCFDDGRSTILLGIQQ